MGRVKKGIGGRGRRLLLSAGRVEVIPGTRPIGVGFLEAAVNLSRLLERQLEGEGWEEILFLGTAGSYGEVPIGGIVVSSRGTQWELGGLKGGGYSPIPLEVEALPAAGPVSIPRQLEGVVGPVVEGVVNSSHYITTDWEGARLFREKGVLAESMEHFGILKVANSFQLPARGVYFITNYTDQRAHRSYLANLPTAIEVLRLIGEANRNL